MLRQIKASLFLPSVILASLVLLLASGASGFAQSATSPTVAPAPKAKKRFFRAPDGQLFVPAGDPINMSFGLGDSGDNAGSTDKSSVILKEGPNSLQFGVARVPVIADGTPPKTTLTIDEPSHVQHDGLRVLPNKPRLRIAATDALSGVAQTLVSLDGAAFVPLPADGPVFSTEGIHHLRYLSIDQVGNVEKPQEFVFELDSTAPKTVLDVTGPHHDTGTPAGTTAGIGAVVSLTATDAVAGVQSIHYRLDDKDFIYDKPLQLDTLAEGPHRLQYFAVDQVANTEPTQSFNFIVDRQPPDIILSIHGPQSVAPGVRYVAPSSTIALASSDSVAGATPILYGVDGEEPKIAYTHPFHLPSVTGIHRLRLSSVDPVDNRTQNTVTDLYIDMTPPETEIEYSRPFFVRDDVVVLNPASRIALNASDLESGVASVTYSLDDAPEQKYTQPFSIAAEGDHHIAVTSIDHVGNREPVKQIRIHVQQAANAQALPATLDAKRWYMDPKRGLIGPTGLPFELRIAVGPEDGAENYLVSSGPTPSPAPVFTVPGPNTMKVELKPRIAGYSVLIDAAPPKTQLSTLGARRVEANGTTYFGAGLKLSLASEDAPPSTAGGVSSGLWKTFYSLDGSAFTTYAKPLTAFTREGAYTLRYYALDNVGNAESPQTFNFTVDTTAPKTRLELTGPHHGNTVAPVTRVVLTTTDNLSGIAQVTYRIDAGPERTYTEPFAIGSIGDGPHRLRYTSSDIVGNREEEHLLPFTLESKVATAAFEIKGRSVERGGTIFVASGALLVLKVPEGETVQFTLDANPPKPYSSPLLLPSSGEHRVSFHAVDELGNVSEAHTLNLYMDPAPPVSHLHFDGPRMTTEGTPLIGGTTRILLESPTGAMGSASLEYSVNGGGWQTYKGGFTLKNSGKVDLAYRSRNPLGLTEPPQHERFAVDAQGPVIDVTFNQPVEATPALTAIGSATLIFLKAEDHPAGLAKLTYKIDAQPELIYRSPLSGLAPGKLHTITVVAEDLLGNRSEKTLHLRVKETAR